VAPSIVVAGFVDDGLGIGASARAYATTLAAAGCDVAVHAVPVPTRHIAAPPPDVGPDIGLPRVGPDEKADVVICCIHPPELARYRLTERQLPFGRVCIGGWVYEADPAPAWWQDEATRFDEIWSPSAYSARLLGAATGRPTRDFPHPIAVDTERRPPPADGPVLVLADGGSTMVRKNIVGAIGAYRRAVGPDEGRRLVVKLWNSAWDPDGLATVRDAIAGRLDVEILDRFLDRADYLQLLASASCLLSLHRSEGFGLTLFEAVALGVPVVCTEGTGPGQYLADGAASLVAATPAQVPDGVPGYEPGGVWLDPDVDDAADKLAKVLADPVAAACAADEPARRLLAQLDASTIGARMRSALEEILDRSRAHRRPSRPAVTVVAHATDPTASNPLLEAIRDELAAVPAEMVLGVPADAPAIDDPGIRLVTGPSTSPFDLRVAALAEADGDLVVVTEDHCRPSPGWLRAYVDAFRTWPSDAYAGPVEPGENNATSDWANYLVGFSAWAAPLAELPDDRAPTVANFAVTREALRRLPRLAAGTVERDLVTQLWRERRVRLVRDAVVAHQQNYPLRRHAANHFRDCRTAGAHERGSGAPRRSLRPGRMLADARGWAAAATFAVDGKRPHLAEPLARARRRMLLLGLVRSAGLLVGSWFGAGRAGERLA
jgi:glycosyltransferase involved in cell wall biosynthesis